MYVCKHVCVREHFIFYLLGSTVTRENLIYKAIHCIGSKLKIMWFVQVINR